MILRFSVGVLALLMGLALSVGPSGAQYYPPYGPQYLPPPGVGAYRDRAAPPPYDEDDMEEEPPTTRAAPVYPPNPYAVRPQPADPRYTGRIGPPDGAPYSYEAPYGVPPRAALPAPYGAPVIADPDYPAQPALRPPGTIGAPQSIQPREPQQNVASLPPEDQPEIGEPKALPEQFRRQLVDYQTKEPAGTIVIDTPNTYLYLALGNGKALRYGIGVGREGFTWAGHERISKMQEWPDWHPPAEMIQRQPYLPRFMAGGPGNPLGARALYLGNTLYRIHGTNQPSTIGQTVSSGCIRLVNDDIEDLFSRVQVGTRVVVLPGGRPPATASAH
jgi:lipoprotein-anchoring transpeptidase ErfK/SrfK